MESMLQSERAKATVAQQIQESRAKYKVVPVYPTMEDVSASTVNANVRDSAAISGTVVPEYAKELKPSGDPETITEIPLDVPTVSNSHKSNGDDSNGIMIMARAVHDMLMYPWTKPEFHNDVYVPVENLEQAKELCESLLAGDESI